MSSPGGTNDPESIFRDGHSQNFNRDPVAGAFYDAGGQVFNVKHPAFGAVGDGVTDDTTALVAALAAGAGAAVQVPPGDYLITSTLTVPSNTLLFGAGKASRIFTTVAGVNLLTVAAGSSNITIADLTLECSGANQTDAVGNDSAVYVAGTSAAPITDVKITRCRMLKTDDAITIVYGSRCVIADNTFLQFSGAAVRGSPMQLSTVVGNVANGDRTGIGNAQAGVNFAWLQAGSVATDSSDGNAITGNAAKTLSFEGVNITRGRNNSITGNTIDTAAAGVSLSAGLGEAQPVRTAYNTITGNVLRNLSGNGEGNGVQITAAAGGTTAPHHNVVTGNVIETAALAGVQLQVDAADNLVEGNTIIAALDGIAIAANAGCARNHLVDNHITSFTSHGVLIQGGVGNVCQNNRVHDGVKDGVRVNGATCADTIVEGNTISNCDNATAGAGHGIQITNGTRTIIRNNRVFSTNVAANQLRGILTTATPTLTVIEGNDVRNNRNTADGISNSDTTASLWGNIRSALPICGQAALSGGTATVSTAEILAGDSVLLTIVSATNPGALSVGTIVAGTSFVINSTSGTDGSTVFWEIVH